MLSKMTSIRLSALILTPFLAATVAPARPQDPPAQDEAAPRVRGEGRQGRDRGDGPPPLVGKIIAIQDGSLELSTPEGSNVVVKLSDKTEFHKDRQPAKIAEWATWFSSAASKTQTILSPQQ